MNTTQTPMWVVLDPDILQTFYRGRIANIPVRTTWVVLDPCISKRDSGDYSCLYDVGLSGPIPFVKNKVLHCISSQSSYLLHLTMFVFLRFSFRRNLSSISACSQFQYNSLKVRNFPVLPFQRNQEVSPDSMKQKQCVRKVNFHYPILDKTRYCAYVSEKNLISWRRFS